MRHATEVKYAFALAFCVTHAWAQAPDKTLRDVRSIRSLLPEAAGKKLPVHLHGVVTALSGWKNSFFLEDSTGGISIDRIDQTPELRSGDQVDVTGVTGPGLFAPVAISSRIRIVATGSLTDIPVSEYGELLGGRKDSERVAVRGVVRSVEIKSIWDRPILYLRIDTGMGQLTAHVLNYPRDFEHLRDAEVLVRGVCGTKFNGSGQFVAVRIFVSDMTGIEIEKPAPDDPFSVPVRSIDSLSKFQPSLSANHRVRVRGIATFQIPGKQLYVQSQGHALAIQSSQETRVMLGTEIEAIGFMTPGAFAPVLEDSVFRANRPSSSPHPHVVRAPSVITQKDGFNIAPLDGVLVSLEAELLERMRYGGDQLLVLRDGASVFTAKLENPLGSTDQIPGLVPGSIVRVEGICSIESDHLGDPKGFQILMRSSKDVTVLHRPSWWDLKHTLCLFGLAAALVFLALRAILILRRRVRQQLSEIRHKNAELQEQTIRAESANCAKSEFLAAMSHEVRTPMNAILGMADLLWESELNSVQRHYVKVFRRAGANLLTLVNDILDLSKIESGHFEIEHIDFDLEDLIERTVEMIRPKTQAKRIDLIARIAPGVPRSAVGDPTRLQQVLINLLGNSVKFTETGEIILAVAKDASDPSRLHFDVSDTGIGIPKDKLESVFNDFTQAESSTTRRFGGTGLGLGICRRLVSHMGGTLRARSEYGKGSTFYFDAILAGSLSEPFRRPGQVSCLVGRRVLIVDNNSTDRLILAETCSTWGMAASECDGPASAITAFDVAEREGEPFELVIVDRLMPGVDGFEFVSELRNKSIQSPILMITSDKLPGDETRGKQLGVAGYAVKPVRRADLLRLICDALGTTAGGEPECPVESEARVEVPGETFSGRVLIAEDSEDNRFLWEAYLKNTPLEITFVENGDLAVRMAQFQNFDLILMDMQMPVMGGLAATRLIRSNELAQNRPPIPILALTANALRENIEASRKAGCNSHISKPISKIQLLKTIGEYLEKNDIATASGSFSVDLPPELQEASKLYIASRRNDIPQLLQFVADRDFEKLRILAHNMKGTGTSFGFPDVTRLGALIETAAGEQDAALLSEQLLDLSRYIRAAEEVVCL